MSSFGPNVWNIISVTTVNTLSASQLLGLTNSQVNDIMKSPNYEQFSDEIKEYCMLVSNPSRFTSVVSFSDPFSQSSDSSGFMIKYSLTNMVLSLFGVKFLLKLL